MLRLLTTALLITVGLTSYGQEAAVHEPTSATDGDVRLHNTKKSRFHKSTRARKTERITEPVKGGGFQATQERKSERIHENVKYTSSRSQVRETERHGGGKRGSRYKAEVRETERHGGAGRSAKSVAGVTERHGKSFRKSRGSKKLDGEGRTFKNHGRHSPSSVQGTKRSKVKKALGRSNF